MNGFVDFSRFRTFLVVFCLWRTTVAASTENNRNFDVSRDHIVRHPFNGKVSCDTDQIEYRLTKLEVKVEEKSSHLLDEIRDGNRKLQNVEYQSGEVQEQLKDLKNDVGKIADVSRIQRSAPDQLGSNSGFFVLFNTMLKMFEEISLIKRNLSDLVNITSSIVDFYQDLPTKDFITTALEQNLDRSYPALPPNLFQVPFNDTVIPTSKTTPTSCQDIQDTGETGLGIFNIHPKTSPNSFLVICDLETRGGGWTYIHNRFQGNQDFYLTWNEYKNGFGNLAGEFWLGLEHLHELTGSDVNELLVELLDVEGKQTFAHYSAFSVGSEAEGYPLKALGGYQGDAGDSLTYHAGARFSTNDRDQDTWAEGNCAKAHTGAWWYKGCDKSNLNGRYFPGELPDPLTYQGMYWDGFGGPKMGLMQARMMIRPRGPNSPPIFVKKSTNPQLS